MGSVDKAVLRFAGGNACDGDEGKTNGKGIAAPIDYNG